MLHTPLKADYDYTLRRLPGQSKTGKGEKGSIYHFDVYLHLPDSTPGREDAMKVTISLIRVDSYIDGLVPYKMVMPRQNQKPCLFAIMSDTEFHDRVVVL